ncbi:MAG TPA: hypothetical protein VEQ63_12025 [Bryobacteraceae bacterium]|nr:hypothetical protein [Bryobacteraceae bacterium]
MIYGGGPAGASAGLAALADDQPVTIVERSRFPRHKVCGEFLSPEILPLMDRLKLAEKLQRLNPARVTRMRVCLGRGEKTSRLPEAALGLSRYELDRLLLESARARGAAVLPECSEQPDVVATGRSTSAPRGDRLFGFKAHFRGPCDDAVELFFFNGCYVGLNAIEGGLTNVCGLGPERLLSATGFDIDGFLAQSPPLRARLAPLTREFEWLFTGPLVFQNQFSAESTTYLAGDAVSFVDPFTGSGILSAVSTGILAGRHAARGVSTSDHLRACRDTLSRPFGVSSIFRRVADTPWAAPLLQAVPGQLLFWATRPRTARVLRQL